MLQEEYYTKKKKQFSPASNRETPAMRSKVDYQPVNLKPSKASDRQSTEKEEDGVPPLIQEIHYTL